jgi:hypothetical protein
MYEYMKYNEKHFQHKIIKDMCFKEYLLWRKVNRSKLQKDFFYTDDFKLVNDIFKIEELSNAVSIIEKRLQINLNIPIINKSKRDKYYINYYDNDDFNLVYDLYKDDFITFKYDK